MLEMFFKDFILHAQYSANDGVELRQDIDAVSFIPDHLLNAADLAFYPF